MTAHPSPPADPFDTLTKQQLPVAQRFEQHLLKAGATPNEAHHQAAALAKQGWRVPIPRALPEYDLNPLQGSRPPWAWMNLDTRSARILEASVQEWVATYNESLALEADDLIPACWRLHPPLVQVLPVMFWSWHNTHRHPQAIAAQAAEWHLRTLPTFQSRLDRLVGENRNRCRRGEHQPGDQWMSEDTANDLLRIIRRYGTGPAADLPAWQGMRFGT